MPASIGGTIYGFRSLDAIGDEVGTVLLNWDALQQDCRVTEQFAGPVDDQGGGQVTIVQQAAAGDHCGPVCRDDLITIDDQPPGHFMADDLGLAGRQPDRAAIDRHHGVRDAPAPSQTGMFLHMAAFAVHWN